MQGAEAEMRGNGLIDGNSIGTMLMSTMASQLMWNPCVAGLTAAHTHNCRAGLSIISRFTQKTML